MLIRHARSVANVDPRIYRTTPDHAIPLIDPEGDADALRAAKWLRDMDIDAPSACAWNSPYLRCKQTRDVIVRHAFDDERALAQRESFLLREQEFGDWDNMDDVNMQTENPRRYKALLQVTRGLSALCSVRALTRAAGKGRLQQVLLSLSQRRVTCRCCSARHALHEQVIQAIRTFSRAN